MLGITNESITEKWPERIPAETLASIAATSPRTITMYFPEQMDRERISSTAAAFSMASVTWKPAAMLVSSINPMELSAIWLCHDFDIVRGHLAGNAIDRGVYVCAEFGVV